MIMFSCHLCNTLIVRFALIGAGFLFTSGFLFFALVLKHYRSTFFGGLKIFHRFVVIWQLWAVISGWILLSGSFKDLGLRCRSDLDWFLLFWIERDIELRT